jgi:hypothetical protein
MSNDKLTELEHRLAIAERELEKTRTQVRVLQEHQRPRSRRWRDGMVGLFGLVLVFAVTRAINTEAQGASPQVLTVKAPFQVVDAGGKVILKAEVRDGKPELTIGDLASGGTTLGVGASGAGFVLVRTASGTDGVALGQYKGTKMGVSVLRSDGQTLAGRLSLDANDLGRLQVGSPDEGKGGVDVGVGTGSGAGFVMVHTPAGKDGVALGIYRGGPIGVSVFAPDGEAIEASLAAGQKGGSVKVMNVGGVGVAALLAGDTGGGLALTGPAGGKSAVSLAVDGSGGKVRVFPQAGGTAQAELGAASDGGGAVNVYNKAGEPVAWVEATGGGNGQFVIGRGDKVYVKAAVLENGRGMVATGPQIGGAPVGMVLPNILVGRVGK